MENKQVYAVIDTNVLVSALLSGSKESNPLKIIRAIAAEMILPLYNNEILDEYSEVLSRDKFHFSHEDIRDVINLLKEVGLDSNRIKTDETMPDPKDVVFYEISLSRDGAYLVTGNKKHFPVKTTIVSPAEMAAILKL